MLIYFALRSNDAANEARKYGKGREDIFAIRSEQCIEFYRFLYYNMRNKGR